MNKLVQNNVHYKIRIDNRKLFKTFTVGYVVLHAFSTDPFQILKKLNCNAYVIYLSKDFSISSAFNIENLVDYKGIDFNPSNFFIDEPSYKPIFERSSLHHFQIFYPIQ